MRRRRKGTSSKTRARRRSRVREDETWIRKEIGGKPE